MSNRGRQSKRVGKRKDEQGSGREGDRKGSPHTFFPEEKMSPGQPIEFPFDSLQEQTQ